MPRRSWLGIFQTADFGEITSGDYSAWPSGKPDGSQSQGCSASIEQTLEERQRPGAQQAAVKKAVPSFATGLW